MQGGGIYTSGGGGGTSGGGGLTLPMKETIHDIDYMGGMHNDV